LTSLSENWLLEILNSQMVRSIIIAVVTVISAIIVQRILKKLIRRFCEKVRLSEHVRGILTLISTVVVTTLGILIIFNVAGLPVEWFALTGTLTGTAIGFASTQSIGNFLAGLYLLVTTPFKVLDYIKIGSVEGEVRAVTINYTRVFTPTYNLMEIPNREVLNSRIENCAEGALVDYTFTMGFDHTVANKELTGNCIAPAIDMFYAIHEDTLPRKPEYSLTNVNRLERTFAIRFFFQRGKAERFYDLQPKLTNMILERWDLVRMKPNISSIITP
jgi:hypothetical protein